MQSWTIGIICYNEKGTIKAVYEQVATLLKAFDVPAEIIIVDDCSTDGSKEIIADIAARDTKVRAIYHPQNQGIGGSIRDVYFNGTMENIVFVPGDGQFDVEELRPYKNFANEEYISFYRKENMTYSAFRNILSYLNKLVNKLLLGLELYDVNWVKIYKEKYWLILIYK